MPIGRQLGQVLDRRMRETSRPSVKAWIHVRSGAKAEQRP
jgi:hypothetical protein